VINPVWRTIYRKLKKCLKRRRKGKIVVFCWCFE